MRLSIIVIKFEITTIFKLFDQMQEPANKFNKEKMMNTLKQLAKKLFSKRVRTKRDLQMLWGLQMRAWLTFFFQTLNKMYIMISHEEYKGLLPICKEQCSEIEVTSTGSNEPEKVPD